MIRLNSLDEITQGFRRAEHNVRDRGLKNRIDYSIFASFYDIIYMDYLIFSLECDATLLMIQYNEHQVVINFSDNIILSREIYSVRLIQRMEFF